MVVLPWPFQSVCFLVCRVRLPTSTSLKEVRRLSAITMCLNGGDAQVVAVITVHLQCAVWFPLPTWESPVLRALGGEGDGEGESP